MRDLISIPIVEALHPYVSAEVQRCIETAEEKLGPYIAIWITQGLRAFAIQAAYYAIGRTVKGANARPGHPMGDIITNAKPGQSPHQYGLAVDFCLLYDKDHNGTFESVSWDLVADFNRDGEADWKEVVDTFESFGYVWGGDWHSLKDNPHFEKTKGLTWEQLYALYEAKNFIPGTEFVNLS